MQSMSYISGKNSTTKLSDFTLKYAPNSSMLRECYNLINRFVVQSAQLQSHNSQLINTAQLHWATSLCVLMFYLAKEKNVL